MPGARARIAAPSSVGTFPPAPASTTMLIVPPVNRMATRLTARLTVAMVVELAGNRRAQLRRAQLRLAICVRLAVPVRLAVRVPVRCARLHRNVGARRIESASRARFGHEVAALVLGIGPRMMIETIPDTKTSAATNKITAVVPTQSAIVPTTMIGRMLADRDEHVEDAEDAPADLRGDVLLELDLRRDRHDAVGRCRRGTRWPRRPRPARSAPTGPRACRLPPTPVSKRLTGPATVRITSSTPRATSPTSIARRRAMYLP